MAGKTSGARWWWPAWLPSRAGKTSGCWDAATRPRPPPRLPGWDCRDATVGVWWPGAVTRVRLLIKPSVTGKSSVPY